MRNETEDKTNEVIISELREVLQQTLDTLSELRETNEVMQQTSDTASRILRMLENPDFQRKIKEKLNSGDRKQLRETSALINS